MQEPRRAMGGASTPRFSNRGHSFFKSAETNVVWVTEKSQAIQCRILPARDLSLSVHDAAFATSWVPYRTNDGRIDEDTKTPAFSDFFTWFLGYKFWGRGQHDIVSPATLRQFDPNIRCPISDCHIAAKSGVNQEWHQLVDAPKVKTKGRAVLYSPRSFALLNLWYMDARARIAKVGLFAPNYLTIKHLKTQLSWPRPAEGIIISPEWPGYALGDVTHPTQGLLASLSMGTIPMSQNSSALFTYSQKDGFAEGTVQAPVIPGTAEGDRVLSERYNIWDYDNGVLKIPTAQEIVDIMVGDGCVPYDLIQYACSGYANLPAEPHRGTHFPPPASSPAGAPPRTAASFPPTSSFPSSAPAAPAAFPAAAPAPASAFPMAAPRPAASSFPGAATAAPAGFGAPPPAAAPASPTPVTPPPAAPVSPETSADQLAKDQAEFVRMRDELKAGKNWSVEEVMRFTRLMGNPQVNPPTAAAQ